MQATMATTETDKGPIPNYSPGYALYYISFVVVFSFFFLNIFVALIILTFQQEGEREIASCELDRNQVKNSLHLLPSDNMFDVGWSRCFHICPEKYMIFFSSNPMREPKFTRRILVTQKLTADLLKEIFYSFLTAWLHSVCTDCQACAAVYASWPQESAVQDLGPGDVKAVWHIHFGFDSSQYGRTYVPGEFL